VTAKEKAVVVGVIEKSINRIRQASGIGTVLACDGDCPYALAADDVANNLVFLADWLRGLKEAK